MIKVIVTFLCSFSLLSAELKEGELKKDTSGVFTKEYTLQTDAISSKKENIFEMATLFVIGSSLVKFLKYKKPSADMLVAAGAGAAYMLGEFESLNGFKAYAKAQTVKLNVGNKYDKNNPNYDKQVESLKDLKKMYEETEKKLKKTKQLQEIAFKTILVSEGIALWQNFQVRSKYNSCMSSMQKEEAPIIVASNTSSSAEAGLCLGSIDALKGYISVIETSISTYSGANLNTSIALDQKIGGLSSEAISLINEPLCTGTSFSASLNSTRTACTEYFNYLKEVSGFGVEIDEKVSSNQEVLKTVISFLIPRAHAIGFLGAFAFLGGAGIAYYAGLNEYTRHLDTMMYSPFFRAIAWPIVAGAVKLSIQKTDSNINKTQDNIKKIDVLLHTEDNLNRSVKAQGGGDTIVKVGDKVIETIPSTDTKYTGGNLDCLSGQPSSAKCQTASMIYKNSNLSIPNNFPFAGYATSTIKSLDTLQTSNGLKTGDLNYSNGTTLNAIMKNNKGLRDQLKNIYPNYETQREKSILDFGGRSIANIEKTFAKNPKGTADLISSITMPGTNGATDKKAEVANIEKSIASTLPSLISNSAPKNEGAGFSFAIKEDGKSKSELEMENVLSNNGRNFVLDKNTDVHRDFGPTLFQILSHRYISEETFKRLSLDPI
jgi:hypothetical protein